MVFEKMKQKVVNAPGLFYFIFLIRIVGVESKLGPLGTSTGLLYLPRVIVRMENSVE
jgi:hypothetical protein